MSIAQPTLISNKVYRAKNVKFKKSSVLLPVCQSPAKTKMDSTSSVQTNPPGKKGNSNGPRRGSNPSNLGGGSDSGITSPRSETNNEAPTQQSKRRPSVSSGPPKPSTRPGGLQFNSLVDPKNVSLFAHLPQVTISSTSPTASITSQLLKNGKEASIHPAIIKLGLAFAEYRVMGAAERCRQMLLAFKQVNLNEKG